MERPIPSFTPELEKPKLRIVDAQPIEQDGEESIVLRDPMGISENMIVLPIPVYIIATLFDGEHSLDQIQKMVSAQFRQEIPRDLLEDIVLQLDEQFFLETKSFEERYQKVLQEFRSGSSRKAAHAGQSYSEDAMILYDQFSQAIEAIARKQAPQRDASKEAVKVLVAPHIDIHRGEECFALSYRELVDEEPADLYIIFGTAHHSKSSLITLTRHGYDTPLGLVETDKDFVEQLSEALDDDLFEEELLHKDEHSIEFQALWLKYILGDEWKGKIVPILCGSLHSFIEDGSNPCEDQEIRKAMDAIRALIDNYPGRVAIIAGADMSHVGKRFGDEEGASDGELARVEKEDQEVLKAMLTGKADTFFDSVAKIKDRNNICGLSPIFMALDVAQPAAGHLLSYEQSVEKDTDSFVTYAGVVYYGQNAR